MEAAIKETLIESLKLSPIKIMAAAIYGSWARGAQTKNSDVDILIISNEVNPKRQRRGKEISLFKESLYIGQPVDVLLLTETECVSNFRNHNPLFLDIAWEGIILIDNNDFLKNLIEETLLYVNNKKIEKLTDGWRFPVLYREPTYLSNVSNKDFAIVMLTDGERDFNIGISLIKENYFDKAIYHFQQAVEKAIKSVLISFGEFKKTHFVGGILIDVLKNIELEVEWKEKLYNIAKISNEIEPEVTWSRYPGIDSGTLWIPYEEYTMADALEIKEKAQRVMEIAKDFVVWWFKLIRRE